MNVWDENLLFLNSYKYANIYHSLGSNWCVDALDSLGLEQNFVLVNLCADLGYYERDAYDALRSKYHPTFLLAHPDISKLRWNMAENHSHFKYATEDIDASEADITEKFKNADVIIDNKGAIWNVLCKPNPKKKLLKILKNYRKMMRSDKSVLLIDYYDACYLKFFCQFLTWGANNVDKRFRIIKTFGEESTYMLFKDLFGKKFLDTIVTPMHINKDDKDKPLSKKFDVAYITREKLDILIKKAEETSEKRYDTSGLRESFKIVGINAVAILATAFLWTFLIGEL